jgi:DNA polymerase III subunit delta
MPGKNRLIRLLQVLKPIYALVGADSLLQQEALIEILHQLPPGVQRSDFDGETAELATVLDDLRSFAMFGPGKAVVVSRAGEFVSRFRSQMEDYAAAPADSATLILRFDSLPSNQRIYKAIQKSGEIRPCFPPKDVATWATQRAASHHKVKLARDAAVMLVDLLGNDLARIDNELAKLALTNLVTGGSSSTITADQIADGVAFQRDREMWDLTNALAAGNPAEALTRWRQLVRGDSSAEFRAVTWLCLWLENVRKALVMVARADNPFTIGQALKIWPRENQARFVDTVKAMGQTGLTRAVNLLAEIDYQTKTGIGDAAGNIERFVLEMATE